MAIEEQETIILINAADLKEGFFRFSTSRKTDFERLCRRVGGRANLLKYEVSTADGGGVVEWRCRVPACYWKRTTFGIGQKRASRPGGNPEALKRLHEARLKSKSSAETPITANGRSMEREGALTRMPSGAK